MAFYADLHIHSKHSRATSRNCDLENLSYWAQRKGIAVVGTGDFTHPAWFDELGQKLVPAEPGLFRLRPEIEREVAARLPLACRRAPTRFMLSVEISTIYKKDGRTRKIHHLIYAPDLATAGRFRARLARIGNIASDGRPILGLDSRHLLEIALSSGDGVYLVPAHIWTPWFAVLGANSGFDVVDQCYGDLAGHVFAIETGLSSDPPMNWRVSQLDRFRLVSNSDAHSPPMLGREACVFETDLDYFAMRAALCTGEGYGGTVEFFPEEGKYHLDGHRKCHVRCSPEETRQRGGLCPVCGKPLTVGVMHRVEVLADRPEGSCRAEPDPFRSLVALPEMISEILRVGAKSKGVEQAVSRLVTRFGPELEILERTPIEDLGRAGSPLIPEAIDRLRQGRVFREAGFDGEYGVIRLFEPRELARKTTVALLFDDKPAKTAPLAGPTLAPAPNADIEGKPAADPGSLRSFGASCDVTQPHAGKAPAGQAKDLTGATGGGSSVLAGLDPEQRAAASIVEGPLLIVAGPGTGKTRTVTHRFAHLIAERGVPSERCLALTFTRRAADEMRGRMVSLIGPDAGAMTIATFHRLGLTIVQEQRDLLGLHRGFHVADEAECVALVRSLDAASPAEARRFLAELSRARRGFEPLNEAQTRFRQALWERDAVDFDDLVGLPVELLAAQPEVRDRYRARFGFLAVDEYQDVDPLQYRLLRLLAPADGHVCAIGDPDQAIYTFRGADVGFFLRFQEDFPSARVVHLQRNYRSSAVIVRGAMQAIAPSTLTPGRALQAMSEKEAPARIALSAAPSEAAEAEGVVHAIERLLGGTSYFSVDSGRVAAGDGDDLSFADFAVLYRTEARGRAVAEALARAGIPFHKRSSTRLGDRADVQAVVACLRADSDAASPLPRRVEAAVTATKAADPGIDVPVLLDLLSAHAARHADDGLEAFVSSLSLLSEVDTWDPRADRVSLLTLHASKGLEFPVVFLIGCEDDQLPLRWAGACDPAAEAEERRLFFVGMTRAQSRLFLSYARKHGLHGTVVETGPSPFLAPIEAALLEERSGGGPAGGRPGQSKDKHQLTLF